MGSLSLAEVLESDDEDAKRLKVSAVLESLPGVGKKKARGVMEEVYRKVGKKKLSLRRIREHLLEAILHRATGGTNQSNRYESAYRNLYVSICEDAVDHFARGYREKVVQNGDSHTLYVEGSGFNTETEKRRILDLASEFSG